MKKKERVFYCSLERGDLLPLLLMLPTGIVALVMLLTGAEGGIWLAIIPVALANGIGILALGTWLGGKLMDARMLSIVAALDSFASLQK